MTQSVLKCTGRWAASTMKNDELLQLIVFTLHGQLLALDTRAMVEVLEPVPVSPLPFVPAYVEGLINANGQIIPQLNLSTLVDVQQDDANEGTLLIVTIKGSLIALRVGLVQEPIELSLSELTPLDADAELSETHFSGCFSHNERDVYLFNLECLDGVVAASEPKAGEAGFLGEAIRNRDEEELLKEYLLIEDAGQTFACPLADIYEVIDLPTLSPQPGSPDVIAGVGLVRDLPTLVLHLPVLQGESVAPSLTDTESRDIYTVVLYRNDECYCGILVDRIVGLEMIADSQFSTGKGGQVVILDDAKESVTPVLTFEQLLHAERLQSIAPFMPSVSVVQREQRIQYIELLRFYIGDDAYGILLKDVRRILAQRAIEPLLDEHCHLMGTMEVEGKVIPVIDLARQLGYDGFEAQEFIVVNDGQSEWALAVPLTDQILHLPETTVEMMESQLATYVKAFSSVDEQPLSILHVANICQQNVRPAIQAIL